ncbi:MAG: glycosyltransferase family 39 protein [Candidatus Glassbacteria bacterium]
MVMDRIYALALRQRYLLLLLVCLPLYIANLGGSRLFDVDEPRYAETARQMVETGDWLVPRFNGDYRFEKPVLTYWLIGGSYLIFGVNEFAARLSSALAALGTVLLTCLLAGRIAGTGAGLTAGVVLATCLQFVALGRLALTDMHLTFFITAALVLFYLGTENSERSKSGRLFLGSSVACALAVLTKGPVGLALPAAVAGVYLLVRPDRKACVQKIPLVRAGLVFLALSLPWYAAVSVVTEFEFFRVFFLQHNLQRFFGEVAPGGQHVKPIYYYLPVLLAGIYPWSFFVLQALMAPLAESVRRLRNKSEFPDRNLFPLFWALGVLLFFSLSRAKLPTYITPAFPALAVLTGVYLTELKEKAFGRPPRSLTVPALAGMISAAALAGFLILGAQKAAEFPLGSLPLVTSLALLAGPATALALLLRRLPGPAFAAQAAGQAALTLVLAVGVLPLVSRYRQEPQKRLVETACDRLGNTGTLAAYRYRKTAIPFYSHRVTTYLEFQDLQNPSSAPVKPPAAIITRLRYAGELTAGFPHLERIATDHDLVLFFYGGQD